MFILNPDIVTLTPGIAHSPQSLLFMAINSKMGLLSLFITDPDESRFHLHGQQRTTLKL